MLRMLLLPAAAVQGSLTASSSYLISTSPGCGGCNGRLIGTPGKGSGPLLQPMTLPGVEMLLSLERLCE
jgi:hypothetical protein